MSDEVRRVFSRISPHYDLMNHLMSMGVDKGWRRTAAEDILAGNPSSILDIATGTGDLALEISRLAASSGRKIGIVGMDFSEEMLCLARKKAAAAGIDDTVFEYGDALKLKYANGSFDAVTSAFAIRNFDDLGMFAKELSRVLRKGGRFVLLDMANPESNAGRLFFSVYSRVMLAMGFVASRHAYTRLVRTIREFDPEKLSSALKEEGLADIRTRRLVSGIAFITTGRK
jgi:demethylmenaquinone methyltransferase/2-methoxy-6-polyprenyl-1,4-benzoquinol methylase